MERKLIAVAVSTALGLPLAASAVEFAASGHINRAVVVIDQDGNANDGDLQHVDANSSGSRFRFTGSGELDNGLTAGVNLEYSLGATVRHANVYIASEGGTLTIGHTGPGADGGTNARLGGNSLYGGVSNWCAYAGSGPACLTHDANRQPILMYDTPAIGPLSIGVSVGNNDYWDVGAKVAGSFGDSGYDLRVGYVGSSEDQDDGRDLGDEIIGASASVKFSQGTSITTSWGQNDDSNNESQYVEIDHSYGAGTIGVNYRRGEDRGVSGSLWGIGVGHSLGNGAIAYAGYRFVEADDQADLNLFVAGLRVGFN